ncbi:hypothetical protein LINGRAHAP2_LOCUS35153 [Linum grandiflorum]
MSGNRGEASKWMNWKAAFFYFDLNISWMFERLSTRGLGTSTVCYLSCMNSSQGNSRIRFPSLIFLFGFKFITCHSVISLRM